MAFHNEGILSQILILLGYSDYFKQGDPALIMKYINPIEAKFIDDASGIHIKFRLAGVSLAFHNAFNIRCLISS